MLLTLRKGGAIVGVPTTPILMKQDAKQKTLEAVKRLEGLTAKLRTMVEEDQYCGHILEMALAMQGHLKHIQSVVLESHLHTCAPKKLNSPADRAEFINEVINIVGLSRR